MVWQDLVIFIVNIALSYSLSYQVYTGYKEKKGNLTLTTSSITFIGLYIISLTFFSLSTVDEL